MKAIILVGGEGTRLRPLTFEKPKPIIPVANVPLLGHIINWLKKYGVREMVLSSCYKPKAVMAVFGDGRRWGVKIHYALEKTALGTGGAIKNAQKYISGPAVVLNGDIISEINLYEMHKQHKKNHALATIALVPVDNPSAYGLVKTGPDGRIRHFLEKPLQHQISGKNYINAGIYIIEPGFYDFIKPGINCSVEHNIFPAVLKSGMPFYAYAGPVVYWFDLGTPAKYLGIHNDILSGKIKVKTIGRRIGTKILTGQGCKINSRARLKGFVVMGKKCIIEKDAVLENCVIWDDVKIGAGCEIRGSIIASRAELENSCKISNMVIGADSRLASAQPPGILKKQ